MLVSFFLKFTFTHVFNKKKSVLITINAELHYTIVFVCLFAFFGDSIKHFDQLAKHYCLFDIFIPLCSITLECLHKK